MLLKSGRGTVRRPSRVHDAGCTDCAVGAPLGGHSSLGTRHGRPNLEKRSLTAGYARPTGVEQPLIHPMWNVAVYNRRQHAQYQTASARCSLFRSSVDADWQWCEGDAAATGDWQFVNLHIDSDSARIEVHGIADAVEVVGNVAFSPDVPIELPLPTIFNLGDTWFEVQLASADVACLELEPLHTRSLHDGESTSGDSLRPGAETVGSWLAAIGQVHRTAANSPQFCQVAARAALGATGLDAALLLVRENDLWQIAGSAIPSPEFGVSFNAAAADLLLKQSEVWRRPPRTSDLEGSAKTVGKPFAESIIVAPIRDDAGAVVAAIYGIRRGRGLDRRRGIRPLESRVIELLAEAVGAGLARRQQELDSARQLVLLEQAFSPQVVDHLRRQPDALAGTTREASLLFADLRGFTSLSEGLSPAVSFELLAAVMETLTQAVIEHEGVVIDYFGDGLSAMWNAPLDDPQHADHASAAAIQMLQAMPSLNGAWQSTIPRPLELCVGIHSGEVQVGNAGARRRLKYGPRGAAVNMASRVQGAGKYLEVPLLVTASVRRRLGPQFVTLKICTAKLAGFEQPVELFTVFPSCDAIRLRSQLDQYAAALASFECGDLDAAEQELAQLLAAGPATPAEFLSRQTAALRLAAQGRRATDLISQSPDAVIEILAK